MDDERFSKEASIDESTNKLVTLALEMARSAAASGKRYFMGGGLAIDLSLGKVSRNHHDIDFHPELEDKKWWIEWFEKHGLKVKKIENSRFPETFKVENEAGEQVVDLWPFALKEGVLLINREGKYVDSGKHWHETRIVNYEGVDFRVENPQRVLEQKLRHTKEGQPFREQDRHDFRLMGQEPGI